MPSTLEHRVMEFTAVHAAVKAANEAFATKYGQTINRMCLEWLDTQPDLQIYTEEYERINLATSELTKRGLLRDYQEAAFEECYTEWKARREARIRFGALRRGLLHTGRALIKKHQGE